MGSAKAPANTRRIDPAADLREATERNTQERRDEEEADRLEKAEADRAAASAQKKLEDAEAALAARRRAEEAARRRSAMLVPHCVCAAASGVHGADRRGQRREPPRGEGGRRGF